VNPIDAIYLHLPFCGHICPFCAFAVRVDDRAKHESYLQALRLERQFLEEKFTPDFTHSRSLYLGGGTPSKMSLAELEGLLQDLENWMGHLPPMISLEANPEDINLEYAQGLWSMGINRVSLGTQSMDDGLLLQMERKHNAQANLKAWEALRQAGFRDLNLDFLFGLPGQTLAQFTHDLECFISWEPEHLSLYLLNMEERSKIAKRPNWKNWLHDQEDLLSDWYRQGALRLEQAGLKQYEVSNFAKPGFESIQNISNWERKNYLALGQGAHGFVAPLRYGNQGQWAQYQSALRQGSLPHAYLEQLTPLEEREEELMIALRMRKGLPLDWFEEQGEVAAQAFKILLEEGLAEKAKQNYRLTLDGLLVADEVTAWLANKVFL